MSSKGNISDRPFEIGPGQERGTTAVESKTNDTSIYLDLRKSNFSGSIKVYVIGQNSNETRNCTNKGEYFLVESGKKYMLYNQVKESNFQSVFLEFVKPNPQDLVTGLWSPDSIPDSACQILRSGANNDHNSNSSKGNTKDEEFQFDLMPSQTFTTNWRPKYNSSSIYLNLTESNFDGPINVSIFGRHSNSERNCTNRVSSFSVFSHNKYFLYNQVLESKSTEAQLRFTSNERVRLKGKWSPDSINESGCITLTGKEENETNNFGGLAVEPANKADHLIKVPYISQSGIPAGCEGVSATMVLNFYGHRLSATDFINSFLDKQNWGSGSAPDPDEAFIGNPFIASGTNCGYGCYAPCIAKCMNKVFTQNKINSKAEVIKGKSLETLCSEFVNQGTPVLIWATMNMKPSSTSKSPTWTLNYGPRKGQRFTWIAGEHCLVLVGFNRTSYFFNDPYKSNGVIGFPRKICEQRYDELGKQAVVVRLGQSLIERLNLKPFEDPFQEKDRQVALDYAHKILKVIGLSLKASIGEEVPFTNSLIHGTVSVKLIRKASMNSAVFCVVAVENGKVKLGGKVPLAANSEISFTKNSINLKAFGNEIKIDNLSLMNLPPKLEELGFAIGHGMVDFGITKDGFFKLGFNSDKEIEYAPKVKEKVTLELTLKFQFNIPTSLSKVKVPQLNVSKIASSLSAIPQWVYVIAGALIFIIIVCFVFAPELAAIAGGIGVALSQVSQLLQPVLA